LLVAAAVTALLGLGVAATGQFLAARLQASAAADAAALAAAPATFRPGAAGSPVDEASRFAAANGARLVSCRCPIDERWRRRRVVVVVERSVRLPLLGERRVRARSSAEFVPPMIGG
jgi:hypothetical protein